MKSLAEKYEKAVAIWKASTEMPNDDSIEIQGGTELCNITDSFPTDRGSMKIGFTW